MVLTGGDANFGEKISLVTEYSGIASGQVTSRTLPDLVTSRSHHACSSYTVAGETVGLSSPYLVVTTLQVLMVTGGFELSSTELISYPDGQAWREVESAALPSPRYGLRGAFLAGVFHVTGGFGCAYVCDEVLAWDPVAESWSQMGKLDEPVYYHAVAEVPIAAIQDYCS